MHWENPGSYWESEFSVEDQNVLTIYFVFVFFWILLFFVAIICVYIFFIYFFSLIMLLEEKQKFFDLYKKRHVFGEPPKSSWGLRDCPYFVVHCMALGTLGGFYGGGMKNIWDLRKTHTTLLQDLAAPKRTKFTPKPFVLGRYVSKTAVLFGYAARGTLHGAVYGATNCYLRQGLQTSDRTSVFISGLVGTGIGGFLCKYFFHFFYLFYTYFACFKGVEEIFGGLMV